MKGVSQQTTENQLKIAVISDSNSEIINKPHFVDPYPPVEIVTQSLMVDNV